MNKTVLIITIVALFLSAAFLAGFIWWNFLVGRTIQLPPAAPTEEEISEEAPLVSVVAQNLEVPWALDFLPDKSIIFTERPGRVRLIEPTLKLKPDPLLVIEDIASEGEGGLLGIAIHPDFKENNFVYLYYTEQDRGVTWNRVVRFVKINNRLEDEKIIIDNIPGAIFHNGGRIKFGPDGFLYILTGDALKPELSQDKNSLAGKILRLKDDGGVPVDNPFANSPIYSLGHRNPQGITWDEQGRAWVTEHGAAANDEINLIEPGKNYGWPIIQGDEEVPVLASPVIQSGGETWAPSGAAFLDDSLFFAGLRGQILYELKIKEEPMTLHRHFDKNFGRLRDVVSGSDGFLYITTSNRDGRGAPMPGDDRIIRINPKNL